MNTFCKNLLTRGLVVSSLLSLSLLSGCNDDNDPVPQLTGDSKTYALSSVSNPAISGTVTFAERDDDNVLITIQLNGTQAGATHPAHIHANSAAEGGGIVLDLTPVTGADGKSETAVNALNDGTGLTYEDLLSFDGHVNVHMSSDDLGTLIAQGDIGENELTGDSKDYTLTPVADPAVSGTLTIAKRQKGTSLVTVALAGTPAGTYNSHFHANSVAQGGPITINLNAVDGTTGMAVTSVDALNNGDAITYEEMLNYNGHFNVHGLGSYVVQADIGGNELTGDTKVYTPSPVADPAVSGTLTIAKRKRGTSLVTVALTGTTAGSYNSHFHANSVAQGGPITINLNAVDGTTGMAVTSVDTLNNGDPITYDNLLDYNGHFNVHGLGSYLVQADIGGNELTGDTKVYTPSPVADPNVGGTLTIAKRKRGTSLVTVALTGTTAGSYSSHFHANSVAQGGPITINLKPVDGTTGMAVTSVDTLNNGDPITYDDLLDYNGHFNVHGLGSYVVQADIGGNELTGDTKVYTPSPVADPNVGGTLTIAKRKRGTSLVTVALTGTTAGTYNSHFHANTVAEGGPITINLKPVDGTTGMAITSVDTLNNGDPVTYDNLLDYNGHFNVHGLGSYVVQADIGQNELTGDKKEYTLNEVSPSGVSGTATFEKRKNGKTQVTLSLTGTADGGDHPAHIHANDAATGGGIVMDLENVNGATGQSVTSAHALNDETAITYDQLIAYDGHINVHLSPTELGTRLAQGDIGSNVP